MVRYLFSFLLFICFYSSHALEFIVKPYLQFATPTTITVLWETDQQCRSVVRYGEPKFHHPSANFEFSVELQDTTLIHEVAQELDIPVPPCGVLFEVPLAILEMDAFMREIDFASIGTNDLIQYLSAADRNNSKVNYLYNPVEPAFLRIIKNAIDIANNHGKPVSICGEMAGNPAYTPLLVGLGLRRFSVIPRNIPLIKEVVSRISSAEVAEMVAHIDGLDSPDSSIKWVKNINRRILGSLLNQPPFSGVSV